MQTDKKNHLVSIVIATYNHSKYISDAINSALNQTYKNVEIIVVDDGSTDITDAILRKYTGSIIHLTTENRGQFNAYKLGYKSSKGSFIVFLDADDVLSECAIEVLLPFFKPNIVKVHFKLQLISNEGNLINVIIPKYLSEGDLGKDLRLYGNLYNSSPGTGNIYRRSAIAPILESWEVDFKKAGDYFLIYGCVLFGEVAKCDLTLGYYRVDLSNKYELGFGNSDEFSNFTESYNLREKKFREYFPVNFFKSKFGSVSISKNEICLFAMCDCRNSKFTQWLYLFRRLIIFSFVDKDRSLVSKVIIIALLFNVVILPKPLSKWLALKLTNPQSRVL